MHAGIAKACMSQLTSSSTIPSGEISTSAPMTGLDAMAIVARSTIWKAFMLNRCLDV